MDPENRAAASRIESIWWDHITIGRKTMKVALCVLGRGIEKVATSAGDVWRPTRYIEVPSERGGHTGKRARGLNLHDDRSVIAGSNANVLAACQYLQQTQEPPRVVIFAAGRPGYIADAGITEGKVMLEKFV